MEGVEGHVRQSNGVPPAGEQQEVSADDRPHADAATTNAAPTCERCGGERPSGRRHLCDHCRDHCPRCGELRAPHLNTYCRPCASAVARVARANKPDEYNARARKSRAADRPRYRALNKKWRDNNPEKVRAMHLNRWGTTTAEYEARLAAQGNGCAICNASEPGRGRKYFYIDHDHACCDTKDRCCGKCIRGLLCNRCNRTLGMLRDSWWLVQRMGMYLDGWTEENRSSKIRELLYTSVAARSASLAEAA